jgi:hypothetical protein
MYFSADLKCGRSCVMNPALRGIQKRRGTRCSGRSAMNYLVAVVALRQLAGGFHPTREGKAQPIHG